MKNNILKLLLNYISITNVNTPIIFDLIRVTIHLVLAVQYLCAPMIVPHLICYKSPFQYLSSLLCHKKFASEFMHYDGLNLLMGLPYNERAYTGVSICFYALVFHAGDMERLCSYNRSLITPLIR